MPHDMPNGWEPDPQKTGNWRSMFEQDRGGKPAGAKPSAAQSEMPREQSPDDDELALDPAVYKPWILQRGRSRPVMMLDFRRYEPRSGLWSGWAMAYPHLIGMEYTGDTLLSLDFGKCQVTLKGKGLDDLVRHIQQGSVTAIQEYAQIVWPKKPDAMYISVINKI